jgi:diguanylate cyclase (GGDEF)-like protein/PAS domain S-box-containing protein
VQYGDIKDFLTILDESPAGVFISRRHDGIVVYANGRSATMFGLTPGDCIGTNAKIYFRDEEQCLSVIARLKVDPNADTMDVVCRKSDGTPVWTLLTFRLAVLRGEKVILTWIHDVTLCRENETRLREYETRLFHLEHHDRLTGLPNRVFAMNHLAEAMAAAQRSGTVVVVILTILDDINKINDSLGYQGGDAVIAEFGRRLRAAVRGGNTVARIGGNEFLIIVADLDTPALAMDTVLRVLDNCRQAFTIGGHEAYLSARIGMTSFPDDAADPLTLVRNAHAATARSYERGGNNFHFFTRGMEERSLSRLHIESALQHAIERDEFRVHYQPIVETGSRRIVGAEALLRWDHPALGTVSPEIFIPAAEATDFIIALSKWVLETACRDAKAWLDCGNPFRLAVNFSPRQFRRLDLVDSIEKTLAKVAFASDCLEVEVTERLMIDKVGHTKSLFDAMKARGISISIDDFGTGYSALSYLQHYTFDTLKIDRSFINGINTSLRTRSLVTAIVEMARSLAMKVIAEGVETNAQEKILTEVGCPMMQGFLIGKPVPADEFSRMIVR